MSPKEHRKQSEKEIKELIAIITEDCKTVRRLSILLSDASQVGKRVGKHTTDPTPWNGELIGVETYDQYLVAYWRLLCTNFALVMYIDGIVYANSE